MPVFNDSENKIPFAPEGDYAFCVVDFECVISKGQKTAGCDAYELKLELEKSGVTVYETLTDHPSCNWKIDTFLKCTGIKLAKGEAYEFRKDHADSNGTRWVNPLGLRGWARFIVEEYPLNSGKKRNKVATFYTDKEKLTPRVIEVAEDDKPF